MGTKIVIVDSGINLDHPKIDNTKIIYKYNALDHSENIYDQVGHGTAIVGIIRSIDKEALLLPIKIYNDKLIANVNILLEALQYVYENVECDILHLSLGIGFYSKELYKICKAIYDRGTIIVAAFDNSGIISYPASFDCVIGVEAKTECHKATDFYIPEDNDIVDVYAKGGMHRVLWTVPQYAIQQGNSMSAGYVTGYLSKYYKRNMNRESAIRILKNISTYVPQSISLSGRVINKALDLRRVNKVALFPYNKEMTSFVNYSELLPFKIYDIYTCKYLGNMGRVVRGIYGGTGYEIKNINKINYDEFDTLILGHLTELDVLSHIDYKRKLLKECLNNGKNVYAFDSFGIDEYIKDFEKKGLFLYVPGIDFSSAKKSKGKMYQISVPVLGIFGTSSKQGKFTLQLQLRKNLLHMGYNIVQLSTEPTAPLFGIEACIPFGYNSNISLNEYEFISHINKTMYNLETQEPDIIVVGSQSATIPESYHHMGQLTFKQLEFLAGTNPDTVILCVNPNDDLQYIKRNINVIRNLSCSDIIALAIYPFYYENGWQYSVGLRKMKDSQIDTLKKWYYDNLGLKSYAIGNEEDIKKLTEYIIEYYAEEC